MRKKNGAPTDCEWLLNQIRIETAGVNLSLEEQQRYRDGLEPVVEQCDKVIKFAKQLKKAATLRQEKLDQEYRIRKVPPVKRKGALVLPGSAPAI